MMAPLAGHRVLVVDDERAIAASVVRRLQREGAVCTAAHSGDEAQALIGEAAYDLVISDVQMPGRGGLELLEAARRSPEPAAVILMGALGESPAAADAIAHGADAFVPKPLDLELLVHQAGLVLELRGLRASEEAATTGRASGPVLLVLAELVNAFERADPFRAGFSARTARIAVALAPPLSLNPELLGMAARVHDIGMLAVPITEQHAEGPLARPAQHLVRVHPTLGARWIERLGGERAIVAAIAAHQERWDGSGYPGGLAGENIPPMARALGTSAAIAAMAGPRPWRKKQDVEAVIRQLVEGRLSQFGAAEADAAVELLRRMPELAG